MTPMMVVPMLRKIGFCGHMTCVGLLMTQPGPELTLFLSSATNVPVVRLTLPSSDSDSVMPIALCHGASGSLHFLP